MLLVMTALEGAVRASRPDAAGFTFTTPVTRLVKSARPSNSFSSSLIERTHFRMLTPYIVT